MSTADRYTTATVETLELADLYKFIEVIDGDGERHAAQLIAYQIGGGSVAIKFGPPSDTLIEVFRNGDPVSILDRDEPTKHVRHWGQTHE